MRNCAIIHPLHLELETAGAFESQSDLVAAIQETGKPLDKQADVLTDLQGLIRTTQGPTEAPSSNGAYVSARHNGCDDASSSAD